MAFSSAIVKTRRDGTVSFVDGTPTTLALQFEVGDFTWEETRADPVVIRSRGAITGKRKGDDPEITISFSIHASGIFDSGNDTAWDFAYFRGASAGNVSTGGLGYEGDFISVKFEVDAKSLGDSKAYTMTFNKCELTATFAEAESDTISFTGTCLGGITYASA